MSDSSVPPDPHDATKLLPDPDWTRDDLHDISTLRAILKKVESIVGVQEVLPDETLQDDPRDTDSGWSASTAAGELAAPAAPATGSR